MPIAMLALAWLYLLYSARLYSLIKHVSLLPIMLIMLSCQHQQRVLAHGERSSEQNRLTL